MEHNAQSRPRPSSVDEHRLSPQSDDIAGVKAIY